jgi:hypothetical protein
LRVALIHIILNGLKKYPNITQRVKDFSKKINWLGVAKTSTNFVMGMPFTDIGNVLKQDETITLIS